MLSDILYLRNYKFVVIDPYCTIRPDYRPPTIPSTSMRLISIIILRLQDVIRAHQWLYWIGYQVKSHFHFYLENTLGIKYHTDTKLGLKPDWFMGPLIE